MVFSFVLDVPTLLVLTMVICIFYSVGIYFFGRSQNDFNGYSLVALSCILVASGFLLIGLRGEIADFWSVLVANAFLMLGILFIYEGFRQFCLDVNKVSLISWGILVIGYLVFLFYTYRVPSVNARIVVISGVHFVFDMMSAKVLFSDLKVSWRIGRIVSAVLFVISGLYSIVRIINALNKAPIQSTKYLWNIEEMALISIMVLISGAIFGLIWMTSARLEGRLVKMAMHDPLTGVLNRRGMEILIEKELAKLERMNGFEMCVMMLDLDHFKTVNDTYGHSVGDEMLIEFAVEVKQFLRQYDIFGRLGGEEFVIFLPMTNLKEACGVAERIRAHVESHSFCLGVGGINATLSLGVSDHIPKQASLDSLMPFADQALYFSKQNGRNRIHCFGECD